MFIFMKFELQKLTLAVASPRATMRASTKGNCATAPSIDKQKLPPTKELALKLVDFNGEVVKLTLEHDKLQFYFVSTKDAPGLPSNRVWLSVTVVQLWCS